MTKAEQFEALALRCEQATGADRELDAEIWLACVPGATRKQTSYFHKASGRECVIDETRDATGRLIIVPSYTASLDAAETICRDSMMIYASDIGSDGLPSVHLVIDTSTSPIIEYVGVARTIKLAWCAAALRARAQMERGK